jgi:predicted dienelactone hydrolase
MRTLEIAIPIFLLLYLLWPHPRPSIIRFLPAAALILTLIHFAIEGYRWQMIPLYLLTALLGISALIKIQSASDWKPLASSLTVILLAVSTALPILLPVPSIPKTSGPYKVGTTIFDLTDESRRELYSGRDEARKFVVQLWYPADPQTDGQFAPWMENAEVFAPAIASYLRLPSYFLDHLTLVKIPAYLDADIAESESGFPVIVFSHGWNGFDAQNAAQAIELASHGYVVAGINHTYGAITTVFYDGTVAPNNPSALPAGAPDDEYEIAARKLVDQWAGDIYFTLEYLSWRNLDIRGSFFGAFDLSRVGVYGHSTGGGAAIEFCGREPGCKAVLGLDPFMRPVSTDVLENGLSQPAFFMFSQVWADDSDSRNYQLFFPFYEKSKHPIGVISIDGTRHYDFTDLPMLSPIAPQLGLKGAINGKQMVRIMNAYLLAFFDQTLRGGVSNLFESPSSEFPEVKIIR